MNLSNIKKYEIKVYMQKKNEKVFELIYYDNSKKTILDLKNYISDLSDGTLCPYFLIIYINSNSNKISKYNDSLYKLLSESDLNNSFYIVVDTSLKCKCSVKQFDEQEKNINRKGNEIQIDPNTKQILPNSDLNDDEDFENFYDIIIDIKSIKDIDKGWKIKMTKNGEDNFIKHKNEELIRIGVIGNSNKGKSFILSKISKIPLPSGTSIKTEGLSIKYPDLKKYINRKIVLLDSAGLETPVLKNLDDDEKKK